MIKAMRYMILGAGLMMLGACSTTQSTETGVEDQSGDSGMIEIESTVFDAVQYDRSTDTLTLLFDSGTTFEFYDVPQKTFDEFMEARHKGAYYHGNIRKDYKSKRIPTPSPSE